MIKFEEHESQLFRMLEEPVPLTDDAELPVLVRLIQDDTMLGKANKRSCHPDTLAQKIICSSSKLTDDGLFMDGNYTYCYEIIGTLVEEGSKDWALYQMMKGKKVTKQHLGDCGNKLLVCPIYWCFCDRLRCVQEFNCGTLQITVIPEIWVKTADKCGWQIYAEPKPLLAEAKVGDLCKRMDGKWVQIETLCSLGGMPWICYEIGGLRYINNGEQLNTKDRNLDIIDYHPLAPEGSDEWAWQMAKLGIETKCIYGKIRISDSGMIEVCYNGMAYAMPLTQSAENRKYVINKIRECSPDGWQLYKEPKPEPAPKFKVGDWVEVECKNGTKKWTEQCKVICIYRDGDGYGVNFHGNHQPVTYDGEPFSLHLMGFVRVVRKLSHSEVVVPITISGTVRPAYNEDGTIDDEQFQLLPNGSWDGTEMFISFDALDTHTRELVESLLKAQEEEK